MTTGGFEETFGQANSPHVLDALVVFSARLQGGDHQAGAYSGDHAKGFFLSFRQHAFWDLFQLLLPP